MFGDFQSLKPNPDEHRIQPIEASQLALLIGRVLSLSIWDHRKPHERPFEFRAGHVTGGQWSVPVGAAAAFYLINNRRKYKLLKGRTFLTLSGYFGMITLSGELFRVFMLVLAMMLMGLAFEWLIKRLLCQQMIPVALICGAVASALTQLSFPRLLGPFGLVERTPMQGPA